MSMNLKRLRIAAVAAGALGLGALAAGAAGTAAALPPVDPSTSFAPGPLGGVGVAVLGDEAYAMPIADDAGSALAPPRRRLGARDAGAAEVDARYLATPLAERFTQTTPGAANPGTRRGGGETPMTGMLAAVLNEGDSVGVAAATPPVDPPPPPGDGGDDEDDDDDDGGGGGGGGGTGGGGGGGGNGGGPSGVPEIDGDLFGAGLLLLVGGALVLSSRRRPTIVTS